MTSQEFKLKEPGLWQELANWIGESLALTMEFNDERSNGGDTVYAILNGKNAYATDDGMWGRILLQVEL